MNEKTIVKIDKTHSAKNISENTTAIMLSFVRSDKNAPTLKRTKDTIEEIIESPLSSKKSTDFIEDKNR